MTSTFLAQALEGNNILNTDENIRREVSKKLIINYKKEKKV